jgi:hypothetical protein
MQPHARAALPAERSAPAASPGPAEAGRPVPTAGPLCSCGHGKQAHEHYRRGSDCALCGCARFRRPRFRLGARRR